MTVPPPPPADIWTLMQGELGGIVAFAFITGFAIGWTACQRVVVKEARARIQELEERVAKLEQMWYDEIERGREG